MFSEMNEKYANTSNRYKQNRNFNGNVENRESLSHSGEFHFVVENI